MGEALFFVFERHAVEAGIVGLGQTESTGRNTVAVLARGQRFIGTTQANLRTRHNVARVEKANQMTKTKPLSGIRVLDFGAFIAGPYAACILQLLGAEVVKVEPPQGGDAFRRGLGATDPYFVQSNAGKKSLAVNLKTPEGLALVKALLPSFDVIIENGRPGVMDRLGLGAEVVRDLNPSIVYASVSGFGDGGPWADRAAFDTIGLAMSGFVSLMSDAGNPRATGTCVGDLATALVMVIGVLAGVIGRLKSDDDRGSVVKSSLLEAMTAITIDAMTQTFESGQSVHRESRHPAGITFCLKTADGKAIYAHMSSSQKFWEAFCPAIDRPDLADDPRFAVYTARKANYFELRDILEQEFIKKNRDEWEHRLSEAGVPHAPVLETLELPDHPQMQWLDMYEEPGDDGLRMVRPPWRFDDERGRKPTVAPEIGQNTRELALQVLSAEEVDRLIAAGILAQA